MKECDHFRVLIIEGEVLIKFWENINEQMSFWWKRL